MKLADGFCWQVKGRGTEAEFKRRAAEPRTAKLKVDARKCFHQHEIDLLAEGSGQAGELATASAVEDEVSMAPIGLEGAQLIRELV